MLGALFKIEESPSAQKAIAERFGNCFRTVQADARPSSDSTTVVSRGNESLDIQACQRVETYTSTTRPTNACLLGCKCTCHRARYTTSGGLFSSVLGSASVHMKGAPLFGFACTVAACRRSTASSLLVSYKLPRWFAQRIVYLWYTSSPICGPAAIMRVPRVFDRDSRPWRLVQAAVDDTINAEVFRSEIAQGLISPYDEFADGTSVLIVSTSTMTH